MQEEHAERVRSLRLGRTDPFLPLAAQPLLANEIPIVNLIATSSETRRVTHDSSTVDQVQTVESLALTSCTLQTLLKHHQANSKVALCYIWEAAKDFYGYQLWLQDSRMWAHSSGMQLHVQEQLITLRKFATYVKGRSCACYTIVKVVRKGGAARAGRSYGHVLRVALLGIIGCAVGRLISLELRGARTYSRL
jgi:hypothetical protein